MVHRIENVPLHISRCSLLIRSDSMSESSYARWKSFRAPLSPGQTAIYKGHVDRIEASDCNTVGRNTLPRLGRGHHFRFQTITATMAHHQARRLLMHACREQKHSSRHLACLCFLLRTWYVLRFSLHSGWSAQSVVPRIAKSGTRYVTRRHREPVCVSYLRGITGNDLSRSS
jgi:hypothetical protein